MTKGSEVFEKPNNLNNIIFEHLWKYFEIHGTQRMSLFRYYIFFFTLFITSSGFMFIRFPYERILHEEAAIVLSIVFIFITLVFHLLDQRIGKFTHNAINGLKIFEKSTFLNEKKYHIFSSEGTTGGLKHSADFLMIYILGYFLCSLLIITSLFSIFFYHSHQ